jgi:acyl-CoA dehydrogenase
MTTTAVEYRDLTDLIDSIATSTARPTTATAETMDEAWAHVLELGLTAVSTPEARGGSGGTFLDEVVLVSRLAQSGIDGPLVENLIASWVLAQTEAVQPATRTLGFVDNPSSGLVLPWARQADEAVVFLDHTTYTRINLPASEVEPAGHTVAGVPLGTIRGNHAPTGKVADDLTLRARLGVLRAAEILGTAQAAFELARSYVQTREQFGKPLMTIPAVAASVGQISADLVQLECAIERAAAAVHADDPHTAAPATVFVASCARLTASRVSTEVAKRTHQLHGAMGVTGEYPLGRHTRRLWALRDADGGEHKLADEIGETVRSGGEPFLWEATNGGVA